MKDTEFEASSAAPVENENLLSSFRTEDLIAELETRTEIMKVQSGKYCHYELRERFSDERRERISSDCILVLSPKRG